MSIDRKTKNHLKLLLSLLGMTLLYAASGLFLFLYVGVCDGFIAEHANQIKIFGSIVLSLLYVISFVFELTDKTFVSRLALAALSFFALALVILYILKITGVWEKISTVDKLREYIAQFGAWAVVVTIIMQILQVVVLPIPGVVAIGASVALFGAFKGAVISFAGIWLGSVTAFFIGRKLGVKTAGWLVGKQTLEKWLNSVKGKDRALLTFMFVFPFFPDDVLCFVAGLSSMSNKYFLTMITLARLFSVFTTAYSVNGDIIPYDTWWGIAIWIVLFLVTAAGALFVYKNERKIENLFKRLRKKNPHDNQNGNEL